MRTARCAVGSSVSGLGFPSAALGLPSGRPPGRRARRRGPREPGRDGGQRDRRGSRDFGEIVAPKRGETLPHGDRVLVEPVEEKEVKKGGIIIPEGYFPFPLEGESRNGNQVISLGTPYAEIRLRFVQLRDRLKTAARGFGDMKIGEIMELTRLPREDAERAMMREYGEPFVFDGPPDDRFLQAIEAEGLRWTQGRLFHIMGNHHKGKAVNILRKLFARAQGTVELIGLGDSLNDLPFLLAVDRPVLIRRADRSHDPRIDIPGLYRTTGIGPAGWNEAVLRMLT